MIIDSHLFVNGKEVHKFTVDNKIVNFPTQFFLGRIYNADTVDFREVSLKRNVYNFSVISMLLINLTYETLTSI